MDRLNFNHFYYFYIVAKEGSIKTASEKLYISQPTISDQIKLLEEYFDCLLFERKNRSLSITQEGELALEFAEKIFALSNTMTSRLRNRTQLPKTSIDIGITYHMSQYFLYDTLLPLFQQKEISVHIKESQRHLLLADLEEGIIDLVFTDSKLSLTPNMTAYLVGMNRCFAIAHKKYAKYKKNFPESLAKIPYFNYSSDSHLRYELELFFTRYSLTPKIIGQGNDMDLFQLVTEQALAFTIVPEVAKNRFTRNKEIIVLGEIEDLQTSVWGVIKSDYRGMGYELLKKRSGRIDASSSL